MERARRGQGREVAEGLADDQAPAAPFALVSDWVEDALRRSEDSGAVPEPLSMALATVDPEGVPNVRPVMLRFLLPEGPAFVTHLDSAKGRELAANPAAALAITWPALFRSVRFRGRVRAVERDLITDYFVTRPWDARISAWASAQSAPVASRAAIEDAYAAAAARWPDTGSSGDVPVPPRWGGYRLVPDEVEFWAGRRDRLHDRIAYRRVADGTLEQPQAWRRERRQP